VLLNTGAYRRIEMSFRYKMILLLTVFVFVGFFSLQGFAETSDYGAKGALSQSDMDLKAMLTYAIEDEYLAKAEYELIMDKYGRIRPFSNIVRAEEQHIRYLFELFNTYVMRYLRTRPKITLCFLTTSKMPMKRKCRQKSTI